MRTVFTGLGVMAPNGTSAEAYWSATLEHRSGISELERAACCPRPTGSPGWL